MLKIFPRHLTFPPHGVDFLIEHNRFNHVDVGWEELEAKMRFKILMPCSDSS